jgi:hypothetical protein
MSMAQEKEGAQARRRHYLRWLGLAAATLVLVAPVLMVVSAPSLYYKSRSVLPGMTREQVIDIMGKPTRLEDTAPHRPGFTLCWIDRDNEVRIRFLRFGPGRPEEAFSPERQDARHPGPLWPLRLWIEEHLPARR